SIPLHPLGGLATKCDRIGTLLRHSSVVVVCQAPSARELLRLPQQPNHHTNTIPQQAAVTWRVDRCSRHRTINANPLATFHLLVGRCLEQPHVDPLPGLRAHSTDRLL